MSSMLRGKSHKARGKPPAAAAQSTRDATAATSAAGEAPAARYEQVKQHILGIIESGARQAGERLPSELDLVATLGVSRMTVNRALRELAHEGLAILLATHDEELAEGVDRVVRLDEGRIVD